MTDSAPESNSNVKPSDVALPPNQDETAVAVDEPRQPGEIIPFVAQPSGGATCFRQAVDAYWMCSNKYRVRREPGINSHLGMNFNHLWLRALEATKEGITHFVMLHDDISLAPGWLDLLVEEMNKQQATELGCDVLSVVVPIKSFEGVTSTGIGFPEDDWAVWKRFTMHEIDRMPTTFGPEHTPKPGWPLLINTGCWIADLRDRKWPWEVRANQFNIFFNSESRIFLRPKDGVAQAQMCPEDWKFSRDLWRRNVRVMATTAVEAFHWGYRPYTNQGIWGTTKVDGPPEDRVAAVK